MLYKCSGSKRFDDDGNAFCLYEAEKLWRGTCPGCGRYYDIVRIGSDKKKGKAPVTAGDAVDVKVTYIPTGAESFDYVLSGGLVKGSTILLGGVHGGGKTSYLMLVCDTLTKATGRKVLYASSEQSTDKILETCNRLGIINPLIEIIAVKNINDVINRCDEIHPLLTVFDSLQNFQLDDDSPATSNETSHIASVVSEYCQRKNMCSVVISQMNKQMEMAGSTKISHLIETELFLYRFDPDIAEDKRAMQKILDKSTRDAIRREDINVETLRILICGKNRNGEERRKKIFEMTPEGLKPLDAGGYDGDDEGGGQPKKLRLLEFKR